MNRIALRRILPMVQILLWIIMSIAWRFPTDRLDLSTPTRIFEALTWPGASIGLLCLNYLRLHAPTITNFPGAWVTILTAFMAGQWYLVGLWFDRRLGLAPMRENRWPVALRHLVMWVLFTGLIVLLEISRRNYLESPLKVKRFYLYLVVWSALAALASLFEVWRSHRPAGTAKGH